MRDRVTINTGATPALLLGIAVAVLVGGFSINPDAFSWFAALLCGLLAAIAAAVWRLVAIGAVIFQRVDALLHVTENPPTNEVPRDVL